MRTQRRGLLNDLQITHGPRNLLGRFFVTAVGSARERGVELRFGTFDELLAINASNPQTWRQLDTTLDPRFSRLTPENSFCIIGENGDGEVVATQGVRLFDWRGSNLKIEAESLRMFYADPTQADPGESCKVSARSAESITGLVSYAGGVWFRPDFRGGRLSTVLPRIGRTISLTRWNVERVAAFMSERTVAAGFTKRSGFRSVDWDVVRPGAKCIPEGSRLALMSMSADEIVDTVFDWLVETDTEVNRAVEARRA